MTSEYTAVCNSRNISMLIRGVTTLDPSINTKFPLRTIMEMEIEG
jgi:hypothetical protein